MSLMTELVVYIKGDHIAPTPATFSWGLQELFAGGLEDRADDKIGTPLRVKKVMRLLIRPEACSRDASYL